MIPVESSLSLFTKNMACFTLTLSQPYKRAESRTHAHTLAHKGSYTHTHQNTGTLRYTLAHKGSTHAQTLTHTSTQTHRSIGEVKCPVRKLEERKLQKNTFLSFILIV